MRYSKEHKLETHARIVKKASVRLREKGAHGVGVADLMEDAGLTHGGFYGHFGSKDDLAAEAVTRALEQSIKKQGRFTNLDDLVSDYMSERHRADRANGCPVAALGADVARQGKGVRHALTAYVRAQLDRYARLFRDGSAASRRKRAIATLAGMIGALTLARAVDDASLSDEILAAARDTFGKARFARRSVGRRS